MEAKTSWHGYGTTVVKVDQRRWHYTTAILRLRIGAQLTAHFYPCTLALSAGTLMASAGTLYCLVPAHFYPCGTKLCHYHYSLRRSKIDSDRSAFCAR